MRIALLAVTLALSACGDGTPNLIAPTPPPKITAEAGTYNLAKYNGHDVPFINAASNKGGFGIVAGKLIINPDRSYVRQLDFGNQTATTPRIEAGSVRLTGTTLTFLPTTTQSGYVGQVINGTISYGAGSPNVTYEFRR